MNAGVMNNFLLAIITLFAMALIYGSYSLVPKIDEVKEGYPMAEAGIVKGDQIILINNHKVNYLELKLFCIIKMNQIHMILELNIQMILLMIIK